MVEQFKNLFSVHIQELGTRVIGAGIDVDSVARLLGIVADDPKPIEFGLRNNRPSRVGIRIQGSLIVVWDCILIGLAIKHGGNQNKCGQKNENHRDNERSHFMHNRMVSCP
ncbi:MAG: hypothetical protein ACKVT0_07430 [Planctomycetaceae bacterium]